jgi:hypothetical protein
MNKMATRYHPSTICEFCKSLKVLVDILGPFAIKTKRKNGYVWLATNLSLWQRVPINGFQWRLTWRSFNQICLQTPIWFRSGKNYCVLRENLWAEVTGWAIAAQGIPFREITECGILVQSRSHLREHLATSFLTSLDTKSPNIPPTHRSLIPGKWHQRRHS